MNTKITLDRLYTYIKDTFCVEDNSRILIATSGGLDSMVLLHMMHHLPYTIGVAHINHSTREGASDLDQIFVEAYCHDRNIPFHTTTLDYEALNKGNFQNNARNARYRFLDEVRSHHSYDFVATAHHLDDVWETMFINITRGSGLNGLQSIPAQNGSIIRPFLQFSRAQLEAYQKEHNISYREDSSNASTDYARNKVRHIVTRAAKEVFPDMLYGVAQSTNLLNEENATLQYLIHDYETKHAYIEGGYWHLDLSGLQKSPFPYQLLFKIIGNKYGFSYADCMDILRSTTGSKFQTKTHEGLRDRDRLIIRPIDTDHSAVDIIVDQIGCYKINNLKIDISRVTDIDSLSLPETYLEKTIHIRTWKPGDSFLPYGMKGKRKKVKSFLTDLKLSSFEKENVLVAIVDDNIVQVINYRNSHLVERCTKRIKITVLRRD